MTGSVLGIHQQATSSKLAAPGFDWPEGVRVHMVAVDVYLRDAVGNFVLSGHELLARHGIPISLYAQHKSPEFSHTVRPVERLFAEVSRDDLLFFHFSIADSTLPELLKLPCRKAAYFHNVTPPEMLARFDPECAALCEQAFEQLPELARFDAIVASSRATLRALTSRLAGKPELPSRHVVCPPFISPLRWANPVPEPVHVPNGTLKLLYVGRLAPHKKIENLFGILAAARTRNLDAVLLLAGAETSVEYTQFLNQLLRTEFAHVAERVRFLGQVPDAQLEWLYRTSSALLTTSEHEGFGIPLVEAMQYGLPIFAFACDGTSETLSGVGYTFNTKDFPLIAAELERVFAADSVTKDAVVAAQHRRLREIERLADGRQLWAAFQELLECPVP